MTVWRVDSALSMTTSGGDVEGLRAARCGGPLAVDEIGDPDLALERPLDGGGDALGPAQLVLVAVEGAREEDGVERHAVGGGEDLRVDDVAARRRAGAGDDGEQPRMVGRRAR